MLTQTTRALTYGSDNGDIVFYVYTYDMIIVHVQDLKNTVLAKVYNGEHHAIINRGQSYRFIRGNAGDSDRKQANLVTETW